MVNDDMDYIYNLVVRQKRIPTAVEIVDEINSKQ